MLFQCQKCLTEFEARKCSSGFCPSCYQKVMKAKWYQINKEKQHIRNLEWKQKNPEAFREIQKRANAKFYKENTQKCVQATIRSAKKRRQKDALATLQYLVRKNLNTQLRKRAYTKSNRTIDNIGCTWNELRRHIESQMTMEMTWENYGSFWHLEHVCPCSQANNCDELLKLQHYSNLKPLEKSENLNKSNKRTPDAEKLCHTLLGREWRVGP